MSSDFRNVSDAMLCHILRREPSHLRTADVRQAVEWTLDALGRDVIDPAVPRHALDARIDAAAEARKAIDRRQVKKAHAALQKFWSI